MAKFGNEKVIKRGKQLKIVTKLEDEIKEESHFVRVEWEARLGIAVELNGNDLIEISPEDLKSARGDLIQAVRYKLEDQIYDTDLEDLAETSREIKTLNYDIAEPTDTKTLELFNEKT